MQLLRVWLTFTTKMGHLVTVVASITFAEVRTRNTLLETLTIFFLTSWLATVASLMITLAILIWRLLLTFYFFIIMLLFEGLWVSEQNLRFCLSSSTFKLLQIVTAYTRAGLAAKSSCCEALTVKFETLWFPTVACLMLLLFVLLHWYFIKWLAKCALAKYLLVAVNLLNWFDWAGARWR